MGRFLVSLALLCGAAQLAGAEVIVARCVAVSDGDTIRVRYEGELLWVRLAGIDAPEKGQDYSRKAKAFLRSLVHDRDVEVQVQEIDRYGRTLGRVLVGGRDTSLELVRAGLAWHYTDYSDDERLAAAEAEARAAGIHIWSLPDPTPPWRARREGPTTRAPPESVADPGTVYHGNRKSRVFHAPGCPHYHCKNCTVEFESREAAIAAGYRPGGNCKP